MPLFSTPIDFVLNKLKHVRIVPLILIIILQSQSTFSQTDSLHQEIINIDSIRLVDSIKQVLLLKQIESLKLEDQKKEQALLAEIDSLNNVAEQRKLVAKEQIDSLRSVTVGAPVILFGDTLFNIYAKLGSFSPNDRAKSAADKLEGLVNDHLFDPELMIVTPRSESHDILHKDMIIMSVMDMDAIWAKRSRVELADEYVSMINESVSTYSESAGLIQTLKRTGLLILVVVIFAYLVIYMNKGFTTLNKVMIKKGGKYIKGIRFRDYEVLSIERELQLIKWLMKLIEWITILFVVYLLLPIVFSIFPATEGIATKLINLVLDPMKSFALAIIGFIPDLITIAVIVTITHYIVKLLKAISIEISSGKLEVAGFYSDWAIPTFNLTRIIIYAFSFVVIFPHLPGSDSTAFKGVSVFLGVLFSLGSSSAISNIIAGLVITYMRAFKIGDRVKIGDTTGKVLEKSMLVTRIRTIKNEDVTIPNSAIMNGSTINYSSSAQELGLILNTTITIGYDVPWRQVQDLLIEAAIKTNHIKSDPKPFVLQTSLDDFYVSYQINAYTDQPGNAAKTYSELHANIQDLFNTAGVEILSPHYRGNRDGSASTIPHSDYKPVK